MIIITKGIKNIIDMLSGDRLYALITVGLLCIVSYINTLDVPLYFDDYTSVLQSPFIRKINGVYANKTVTLAPFFIQARALPELSFAINYALHEASLFGYHLFNLIIHLANSCLILVLIMLIFRQYSAHLHVAERWSETKATAQRIAFFSAAVFAVHPAMTNAVTYITQRMASLATLFYLLTMVTYAHYRLSDAQKARAGWYLLSIVMCLAAVKSKETAFTLPLMLVVYDGMFCNGSIWGLCKRVAPFLLCVVLVVAIVGGAGSKTSIDMEKPSILQVVEFAKLSPEKYLTTQFVTNPNSTSVVTMSPLEYFYTQFRVVVTYQRMLLVPTGLNFVHDYPFYRSLSEPAVLLSLGFHLLILSAALCLLRLSRSSSRSDVFMLRLAVFGVLWFYLSLAMECSIIPMNDHILEYRMYLPAFGFIVAIVSIIHVAAQNFVSKEVGVIYSNTLLAVVIIAFSVLTVQRNEQWRDPLVFWQDALAKSPNKIRIHGYIGSVYRLRGDMPNALREYRLMLANDFRYGQDHFGLGEELLNNGFYREAVEEYLVALRIRPDKTFVYDRLAEAYHLLGDERSAGEARGKTAAASGMALDSQGVW